MDQQWKNYNYVLILAFTRTIQQLCEELGSESILRVVMVMVDFIPFHGTAY
jgi:hypothetical protein